MNSAAMTSTALKRALFGLIVRIAAKIPLLREALHDSAEKYASTGRAELKAGNFDAAIASYEAALERAPNDVQMLVAAGDALYGAKRFADAERIYRRAVDEEYYNAAALKGVACSLHAQDKIPEAIYYYFRCLDQSPDDYDVLLNLGSLFEDEGQHDQAVEYSRRAAAVDGTKAAPLHNLAVSYFNVSKFSEAEAAVREAIRRERSADSLRLLGLALEAQERTEEALTAYKDACDANPEFGYACLDVGRLQNTLGKTDEYIASVLRAVKIFETKDDREGLAHAYWDLGWAYYRAGDWMNSVQASRAALDIEPNQAPIRFNLGLALLKMGNHEAARAEYEKALTIADPADLEKYAIDDLKSALAADELPGGREILEMLEAEFRVHTAAATRFLASRRK